MDNPDGRPTLVSALHYKGPFAALDWLEKAFGFEFHLTDDIDDHCQRARAAGAVIVHELEDQFYGDHTYSARDLEGHLWSFGQTVEKVTREEAEKASGLKIVGWL